MNSFYNLRYEFKKPTMIHKVVLAIFIASLISPFGRASNPAPKPPPWKDKARTARYVLHISEWGSLASISTQHSIPGFPYANIFSTADGIIGNCSSGTPYFYMTSMDVTAKDLEVFPGATFVVTEAQSEICKNAALDPESPACARVMLTGYVQKVVDPKELLIAQDYLFTRHPKMETWPKGHHWYFGKLQIKHIQLLDWYGGISNVEVEDYYKVKLY